MPEHPIHLRRAWDSPLGRIDLPANWIGRRVPGRLTRKFNAPPIDPSRERVVLVLEGMPGLRRAALNGRDLGPPPDDGAAWEVPADGLSPSGNVLDLELEPDEAGSASGWGRVALVVRS